MRTNLKDWPGESAPKLLTQPLAVILLAIGVISIVTAVIMPINQLTQDNAAARVDVSREMGTQALTAIPGIPQNANLYPVSGGGLSVTLVAESAPDGGPVPWNLRLLTDLGTSIWALALGFVAIMLAIIVATITAGNPFHTKNAGRLVKIAVGLAAGRAIADTVNLYSAHELTRYLKLDAALDVVGYYTLPPFIIAALMLVAASAFRRGRNMADDVDGLV